MSTFRLPAIAAALLASTATAAEPWELVKYAPVGTNGVLTINVQQLLASPRAQKEGWAKKDRTEYLAGAVPVNPSVERVVAVKTFHPAAPAQGGAVALIPTKATVDLAKLGAKLGATQETVGGEPALRTLNGGYLLPLGDHLLGAAWGGTKQQLASWVRTARAADKSPLRRELMDVVADTAGRHHICLAVDADELVDRSMIAAAIANTQSVKDDPDTAQQLESYLAGLSTVTMTASVADRGLVTRLILTSRALPGKLHPDAVKAFVVELLGRNGAMLEDLPSAVAKVSGRTFTFDFRLSDPELARITHLILPPLPGATDADSIAVAPAGPTAEATGRYLRLVNAQIDGLRRKLPRAAGNFDASTLWYDSAANAIVTTSVLGVDPQAVEYGLSTAGRFHAIADSLRGQPLQLAELKSQAYLYAGGGGGRGFFGFWRPYAFTQVDTNLPQIRSKQIELIRQDADNREQVWKDIDVHRVQVQGAMAAKYKLDPNAR